jgi:hypothetical protein
MRRITILAGVGAAAVLATAGAGSAMAATPLNYKVTVINKTPNDLTPLVVSVGDKRGYLWRDGRRASAGLAELARDGGTFQLEAEADRRRGVRQVFTTNRIAPGRRITFNVRTTNGARRLSWATMLVSTNDAFVGQNNFALPVRRGKAGRATINVRAYDAGAERNTESAAHVPALGAHGVGPGERRNVRRHPGIRGNNDVAASQGWGTYAARVIIRPA